MSKDVVVTVTLEDVPQSMDALDILLISTAGEKAGKTHTDLEEIRKDWTDSSIVYKRAIALLNQGNAIPAPGELVRKVTIVGVVQPEAVSVLVETIKAYQEKSDDWYIFLTDQTNDIYLKALGNFATESEPTEAELSSGVEDHRKLYITQTNNKEYAVSTVRTVIVYTKDTNEHVDATWLGTVGSWYPQSVTWGFKMPAGVSVPTLTTSEVTALKINRVNFIISECRRNCIKSGICMDGEWIDTVLGADWIAKEMREKLYDIFIGNPNIPYTDAGFTTAPAGVFETLREATGYAIITENPEFGAGIYNMSVPRRSKVTDQQTASRQMPDISWEARLGGAMHGVEVKGVLEISLT